MVQVAPSPRDVLWHDGSASLYRFRRPSSVRPAAASPVLVVPSMINKWYVVDLRSGASLVEALVAGGLDVPIFASYPLDQVQEAYRRLAEGHLLGKIVLLP